MAADFSQTESSERRGQMLKVEPQCLLHPILRSELSPLCLRPLNTISAEQMWERTTQACKYQEAGIIEDHL